MIEKIHASDTRIVLAASGGGSRAIAELLEVPGASRTVLEAVVPYCERAMIDWLGGRPDQFCAEPTGRAMAMAAYRRACELAQGSRLAGIACTASLASNRPKRGPHRAHVALQTAETTASQSLELSKGQRTRPEEEQLVARVILNMVAEACGVSDRLRLELLPGERIEEHRAAAPEAWRQLLTGEVASVFHGPADQEIRSRAVIFPGAYNPMHRGHRGIAKVASEHFGRPVALEISILNVDKPPLDFLEIQRRLAQFAPEQSVWLTRAPTFEEKSVIFPGATFLVGADTLRRIGDPRYYGGDAAACEAAIERIAARGCRFLVFGRLELGRFVELADLDLQPSLRSLCEIVPEERFREDVSSTNIRRSNGE